MKTSAKPVQKKKKFLGKNRRLGGPWYPVPPPAWVPSRAPAPAQSVQQARVLHDHVGQLLVATRASSPTPRATSPPPTATVGSCCLATRSQRAFAVRHTASRCRARARCGGGAERDARPEAGVARTGRLPLGLALPSPAVPCHLPACTVSTDHARRALWQAQPQGHGTSHDIVRVGAFTWPGTRRGAGCVSRSTGGGTGSHACCRRGRSARRSRRRRRGSCPNARPHRSTRTR